MNWIYWLSIAILWFVIGANICSLIRSIRFQRKWSKTYDELFSDLQKSIDNANRAERCFLDAAKTYREITEELCAEQEAQEEEDNG